MSQEPYDQQRNFKVTVSNDGQQSSHPKIVQVSRKPLSNSRQVEVPAQNQIPVAQPTFSINTNSQRNVASQLPIASSTSSSIFNRIGTSKAIPENSVPLSGTKITVRNLNEDIVASEVGK